MNHNIFLITIHRCTMLYYTQVYSVIKGKTIIVFVFPLLLFYFVLQYVTVT